jgi:hypothetical protein
MVILRGYSWRASADDPLACGVGQRCQIAGYNLKQAFDALRELATTPDPPKRPIGFINPEDKGSKKTSGAKGKT